MLAYKVLEWTVTPVHGQNESGENYLFLFSLGFLCAAEEPLSEEERLAPSP